MSRNSFWPRYVPMAERRRKAEKKISTLHKKGKNANPVIITGRNIANTFWGKSWCDNLENYSDWENRLPRGRTYVRNGSVLDLQIAPGNIHALVMGSEMYHIEIAIDALEATHWACIQRECAGQVNSLVELLQGKLSKGVMEIITRPTTGLFPRPYEIRMHCSCPDYADLCKHLAAVLYGVGARLDHQPELLFLLRQVDHRELIAHAVAPNLQMSNSEVNNRLDESELASLFGIELAEDAIVTNTNLPQSNLSSFTSMQVTSRDLVARGIPVYTIQNWLTSGVLKRTETRGIYQTTLQTEPKLRSIYLKMKAKS